MNHKKMVLVPSWVGQQHRNKFAGAHARSTWLSQALVLLSIALLGSAEARAQSSSPLSISATGQVVTVSGVDPDTPVALVGYMRYTRDGFFAHAWTQMVLIAEEPLSGESEDPLTVDFDLGRPVSAYSVFAAVNLLNGDFALEKGNSTAIKEIAFPSASLRVNSQQGVDGFLVPLRQAYVWIVRPGSGIWYRRSEDGTPQDENGLLDGVISLTIGGFSPVPDNDRLDEVDLGQPRGGQPFELETGDLILTVDHRSLQFYAAKMEG